MLGISIYQLFVLQPASYRCCQFYFLLALFVLHIFFFLEHVKFKLYFENFLQEVIVVVQ